MIFRRRIDVPAWGRTTPFGELENLRRQMDLLTEGMTRGLWRETSPGVFPLMNLTEDKDNYYVRAELPGLKAEDLDISVTADTLSIAGERKLPIENEKVKYHRREREAGTFSRILSLPAQVDIGRVDAKCIDGLLSVILPKAESVKPKQIAVKAS